MRIRKFVAYLWISSMFLFFGFGSFYIFTGENILTGQTRTANRALALNNSEEPSVLGEGDSAPELEEEILSEEEKEVNRAKLLFNEVIRKTQDQTSIELTSTTNSEAVVYFRTGIDGEEKYIVFFGSGLDLEGNYYAWLTSVDDKTVFKKIGNLKLVDDTDVLKLALTTKDDISTFNQAVITLEEEGSTPTDLNSENIVFSGDYDPEEFFGTAEEPEETEVDETEDSENTEEDPVSNSEDTNLEETEDPEESEEGTE